MLSDTVRLMYDFDDINELNYHKKHSITLQLVF
jgi:hypothetical protein